MGSTFVRNTYAIARRELGAYFVSPWAWGVFAAMAGMASFFFIGMLNQFQEAQNIARQIGWQNLGPDAQAYKNLTDGVVVQLWGVVLIITLFVTPILSARLFADERRHKTIELLMTTPVRPLEIVLGKYIAGLGIILATLGITIIYPLILVAFGQSESGHTLEWSTVLLGYLGLLLWGATCMAIGMFISSLTESSVFAALLTFAVLLPWWLLQMVLQRSQDPWRAIGTYISFDSQLSSLMRGVLELKSLVFFASIILLSCLFTQRSVEARRWT
jgi:ABC-2 type transport system permease protein